MNYVSELIKNPSFAGAFLGALITGFIAITVMIIQIRYQNKLIRLEKYKEFYKYIKPFQLSLESFILNFKRIERIDSITNRDIEDLKYYIKDFLEDINEVREEA